MIDCILCGCHLQTLFQLHQHTVIDHCFDVPLLNAISFNDDFTEGTQSVDKLSDSQLICRIVLAASLECSKCTKTGDEEEIESELPSNTSVVIPLSNKLRSLIDTLRPTFLNECSQLLKPTEVDYIGDAGKADNDNFDDQPIYVHLTTGESNNHDGHHNVELDILEDMDDSSSDDDTDFAHYDFLERQQLEQQKVNGNNTRLDHFTSITTGDDYQPIAAIVRSPVTTLRKNKRKPIATKLIIEPCMDSDESFMTQDPPTPRSDLAIIPPEAHFTSDDLPICRSLDTTRDAVKEEDDCFGVEPDLPAGSCKNLGITVNCKVCDKPCYKAIADTHVFNHLGGLTPYRCLMCDSKVHSYNDMLSHLVTEHNKRAARSGIDYENNKRNPDFQHMLTRCFPAGFEKRKNLALDAMIRGEGSSDRFTGSKSSALDNILFGRQRGGGGDTANGGVPGPSAKGRECTICHRFADNLRHHVQSHMGSNLQIYAFRCLHCTDKQFSTVRAVKKHVVCSHKVGSFVDVTEGRDFMDMLDCYQDEYETLYMQCFNTRPPLTQNGRQASSVLLPTSGASLADYIPSQSGALAPKPSTSGIAKASAVVNEGVLDLSSRSGFNSDNNSLDGNLVVEADEEDFEDNASSKQGSSVHRNGAISRQHKLGLNQCQTKLDTTLIRDGSHVQCQQCFTLLSSNRCRFALTQHCWTHVHKRTPIFRCCHCGTSFLRFSEVKRHLPLKHKVMPPFNLVKDYEDRRHRLKTVGRKEFEKCFPGIPFPEAFLEKTESGYMKPLSSDNLNFDED